MPNSISLPCTAVAVDDNKAERTLEVFPTAEQAARAHDVAALKQFGLTAESRLNHPLDAYTEVSSLLPTAMPAYLATVVIPIAAGVAQTDICIDAARALQYYMQCDMHCCSQDY